MKHCKLCRKLIILKSSMILDDDNNLYCLNCFNIRKENKIKFDKIKNYCDRYITILDYEFLSFINQHFDYFVMISKDLCVSNIEIFMNKMKNIFNDWDFEKSFLENKFEELNNKYFPNKTEYNIERQLINNEKKKKLFKFLEDLYNLKKLLNYKDLNEDAAIILTILFSSIKDKLEIFEKALAENIVIEIKEKNIDVSNLEKFIKYILNNKPINDKILKYIISIYGYKLEEDSLNRLILKIIKENEIERVEEQLTKPKVNEVPFGNIENLNGYEFELFLERYFNSQGYTVIHTNFSQDQGADLILEKDNIRTVVQAKKSISKISNKAVQEIVAAKYHYKTNKALVITNNCFTESAIQLAQSNNVELWDGEILNKKINPLKEQNKLDGIYNINKTIECKLNETDNSVIIECPVCKFGIKYLLNTYQNNTSEIICPKCSAKIKLTRRES